MRRTPAFMSAIAATALLALGGCSVFSSEKDPEVLAEEQAAAAARYEPVQTVLDIEIGRTRNGYVITSRGFAPGLGFGAPELRARRQGKPGSDGFIDYDFVAQAPDPSLGLGAGALPARAVRADLQVTLDDLKGAAGIRVHGISGGVQLQF